MWEAACLGDHVRGLFSIYHLLKLGESVLSLSGISSDGTR